MKSKFVDTILYVLLAITLGIVAFETVINAKIRSQSAPKKDRLDIVPKDVQAGIYNAQTDIVETDNGKLGSVETDLAKTLALPAYGSQPRPEPQPKPVPLKPTLIAQINLTTQRMTVSSRGNILHTWRISSGRRGHETPAGTFQPSWMARSWYSRQYEGSPMPYAVFFNRGIATHGTGALGRLGSPASHGCIRLRTAHARTFYKLVQRHGKVKTQIVVTGRAKQPRDKPARARYSYNSRNAVRKKMKIKRDLYARSHFRNAFSNR